MATDRIDRAVVHREFLFGTSPSRVVDRHRLPARLSAAAGLARPAVMVLLASLAILVLLPAALAAQAAIGI